jgi:Phage Tail Collar Domain
MSPADSLSNFPKGTILPFAGNLQAVPQGWALCDGNNGTVNLVNRIPIGTATVTQVGVLDGSQTHTHPFDGTTSRPNGVDNTHVVQDDHSPLTVKGTDHTHTYSGTTGPGSSMPPVTFLFFIQKVQ